MTRPKPKTPPLRGLLETEVVAITEYLASGNRLAAYRKAFPNSKAQDTTAVNKISRMFKRPPVRAVLDKAEARVSAKIDKVIDRYAITKENIAAEMAKVAFTTAADLMSWDGQTLTLKPSDKLSPAAMAAVQEVNEVVNRDGSRSIKIKLKDNRPFLEMLAKHMNMLGAEEKKEDKRPVIFLVEKGDGKGLEYATTLASDLKTVEGKVLSSS